MKIKLSAILLCALLLLFCASGCAVNDSEQPSEPPVTVSPPDDTDTPPADSDIGDDIVAQQYNTLPPDTVMLTANGYDVTWSEFFFYINDSLNNASYYSQEFDYEMLLAGATDSALSYPAVIYGAEQLGISSKLSAEDIESIDSYIDSLTEQVGGEEVLLKRLRENSSVFSIDMFRHLLELDTLIQRCFEEQYGEMGSYVSDESVEEYIEPDTYLLAKHILRLKPDDDSEEGKEKAYGEAAAILEQLDSYDGDDFDGFFDSLMFEHSEDGGGLASFPNGYLFQYGDMVPEFYDGTLALTPGDYSGIIETTYGYHIIYRLPIDYDMSPYQYSSQGYDTSLRQIAANYMFSASFTVWIDALDVSYTDAYNSLDLEAIFSSET